LLMIKKTSLSYYTMVAVDYIPLPTVTAVLKSKIEEVEKCIQLRSISHRHPDLKSLKLSQIYKK